MCDDAARFQQLDQPEALQQWRDQVASDQLRETLEYLAGTSGRAGTLRDAHGLAEHSGGDAGGLGWVEPVAEENGACDLECQVTKEEAQTTLREVRLLKGRYASERAVKKAAARRLGISLIELHNRLNWTRSGLGGLGPVWPEVPASTGATLPRSHLGSGSPRDIQSRGQLAEP